VEYSSNLSAIYTKREQSFPPIFVPFEIFNSNFARLLVPPSDKNENCVVHLKEQSLLEKGGAPASERDKKKLTKSNIQTPCFRSYIRRAMYCHVA